MLLLCAPLYNHQLKIQNLQSENYYWYTTLQVLCFLKKKQKQKCSQKVCVKTHSTKWKQPENQPFWLDNVGQPFNWQKYD